jgi:hypothetical protein
MLELLQYTFWIELDVGERGGHYTRSSVRFLSHTLRNLESWWIQTSEE